MRFLVAPSEPGGLMDDVSCARPGELLYLPIECDNPECRCGKVFRGIASGHATTTALVADVPADEDAMCQMTAGAVLRDYPILRGQLPGGEVLEAVRLLSGLAYLRDVGDVVRVADVDEVMAE
ncbi:hypothetical protein SAMN04489713_104259 [Actinomadura madurae]|uniref:DUF7715 domain-containing protein n=1 Tax=Actinomadura madurae TaxID=1993 RepID=A0A1I5ES80_9ACTN|nr:hypothetical protein [Actinomadura madurae]SFO14375.1 hypothetical protein SAMN04489713_104259 [Actinomadura madurae]